MQESRQAIVAQAFSQLWARIYNPRSACPDVELGFIEREMTQILQALGTTDGPPEERWILAQLLLGPRSLGVLQWGWSESQDPLPMPEDPEELEVFFANEDDRVRAASEAVARATEQLLSAHRIQWVEIDGAKQLRIS